MNVKVFDDRRSWIHFGVGMLSYFHTFFADSVHHLPDHGVHHQKRTEGEPVRRLYGADLRLLPCKYMCSGVVV